MTMTHRARAPRRIPALFTLGFRPFFLGAALWAALAMALWVAMLGGTLAPPTAFDPLGWHAHAFLFGYLGAVIAGFLLTAVPNWTGGAPVAGWPLAALAMAWLAGRATVLLGEGLPAGVVAAADLTFPALLTAVVAREIVAGRNWRNLIVLGLLAVFVLGDALFHWEAARGAPAAQGYGLRLALGAGVMMVAVIGGRIVPAFTRNWLVKRASPALPVAPMQRFDWLALAVLGGAIVAWVAWPDARPTALALALAGALHAVRLARWAGHRTLAEPLVTVLHVGYAFVPLGALALAAEGLAPGTLGGGAAQHLWMAGAIGVMTLAVMTRASLGHTGQALAAGPGTVAIHALLVAATLARVAGGALPELAEALHRLAAAGWIGAFAGFAALYGPSLLRPRPQPHPAPHG